MRIVLLMLLLAVPASGIRLVEKGRSTYSIVVGAGASLSEQRADFNLN